MEGWGLIRKPKNWDELEMTYSEGNNNHVWGFDILANRDPQFYVPPSLRCNIRATIEYLSCKWWTITCKVGIRNGRELVPIGYRDLSSLVIPQAYLHCPFLTIKRLPEA
jgi:hypothetical protein